MCPIGAKGLAAGFLALVVLTTGAVVPARSRSEGEEPPVRDEDRRPKSESPALSAAIHFLLSKSHFRTDL